MLERKNPDSARAALPVSSIIPELSAFDMVGGAGDFHTRFAQIQASGQTSFFGFQTTTGQTISCLLDTQYLQHDFAKHASLFFPNDINGFRNQIVIDLGAGPRADGYLFARDLGARAYIGVEYCFAPRLIGAINSLPPADRTIDYSVIYDSIERVLPALPPESCSFICTGIDDCFPEFHQTKSSMEVHLPRKLDRNGACFLHSYNLKSFDFPSLKKVLEGPANFSTWTCSPREQE